MASRIRVAQSVNRLVTPRLLDVGFRFVVDENAKQWRDGDYFKRRRSGREQVVRFGPMKFGKALGLNVVAERPDGSYEYMSWSKEGLDPADLRYSSQQELESALLRLLYFLETRAFSWLESKTSDEIKTEPI